MDLQMKLKADRQPMTAPEMIEAAAHLSRRLREIAASIRVTGDGAKRYFTDGLGVERSIDEQHYTAQSSHLASLEGIADALEQFGEDV